ncbi:MAG: GGDEF-domain containing protein, partial [Mesorhizobium sp.]
MSILATIKDHSGRIYRGIQFLLVLSIAATALGAAGLVRDSSFTSALIVSMVATGLALLVLMYMRSSVVQRLRS